jgi:hypothetical protein
MLTSTSPSGAERDTETRSWRAGEAVVLEEVGGIVRVLRWKVTADIGRGAADLSGPGPHMRAFSAEKRGVTRRFEIEEYA